MGDIQTPQLMEGMTEGPVTPGAPAKKSTLTGGVFNAKLPTPTDGQQEALQLNSQGRLLVDNSGVTQPISGIVHAIQTEAKDGIIHHYGTVADVKTNTAGTVSYTVKDGKTFFLKGIYAASSGGPCKVQVQSGKTTYVTTFYSAVTLNVEVKFPQPLIFPEKSIVSVIITNNVQAQDVYAFISGQEI